MQRFASSSNAGRAVMPSSISTAPESRTRMSERSALAGLPVRPSMASGWPSALRAKVPSWRLPGASTTSQGALV